MKRYTSTNQALNLHGRSGERQAGQAQFAGSRERSSENVVEPSGAAAAKKKSDNKCTCNSCVKRSTGSVAAKWEESDAKQHIRQSLEGDETHEYWNMKPGDVYNSNKILFHQYKYENFRTNLNSLKKSIALNTQQIKFDELAIKEEAKAFKRGEVTNHGNLYYDTSKARESLVMDVKDGTAHAYKNHPRDLRAKRPEYQSFGLNVFTKHFNREIRRANEEVGWQHRQNVKGSKMNHQKHNNAERGTEEESNNDG